MAADKDQKADILSRFRQLWNGGERRRAVELAQSEKVTEAQWSALLAEFPGIRDVINQ